jgi:predicted aconitase
MSSNKSPFVGAATLELETVASSEEELPFTSASMTSEEELGSSGAALDLSSEQALVHRANADAAEMSARLRKRIKSPIKKVRIKDIEKRRKRTDLNTDLNIFCINRIRFR